MVYKCKYCGHSESSIREKLEWCLKCEDLSLEKIKVDSTEKTTSYGFEHRINCIHGCGKLSFGYASDVNLGNTSRDVVLIYCQECNYEECILTK